MCTCTYDLKDLNAARDYLQSVRDEFEHEPELLSFYEPSAIRIVQANERLIEESIRVQKVNNHGLGR